MISPAPDDRRPDPATLRGRPEHPGRPHVVTAVSVLVPYRPDGADRDRAWSYVREWWWHHQPGWEVITGASPDGPWCKALAVADALSRAQGRVLMIADADVFCDPGQLGRLAQLVGEGSLDWAVPHRQVVRLTAAATADVLAGGGLPALPNRRRPSASRARPGGPPLIERAYTGREGGGLTVIRRSVYEQIPLDPRFVGWGQEDTSWAVALQVMGARMVRHDHTLWHLWHPPAPRLSLRRGVGSVANLELHHRYLRAVTPDLMRQLLDEARGVPADGIGAP